MSEPVFPDDAGTQIPTEPVDPVLADPMQAADAAQVAHKREAEMQRVAQMGQQCSQREQGVRQRIQKTHREEGQRAHQAADEAADERAKQHQGIKDFRKNLKQRERDLAEDKRKREAYAKALQAEQQHKQEERKKHAEYMKNLGQEALRKRQQQEKIDKEKAERYRQRLEAERRMQRIIEDADRDCARAIENCATNVSARKSAIDMTARQKLYTLEGWKRMKIIILDNEARTLLARMGNVSPNEAQFRRNTIEAQIHPKRKQVEKEFIEQQAKIEMQARLDKVAADKELESTRLRAQEEAQHHKTLAQAEFARKLEDIERGVH